MSNIENRLRTITNKQVALVLVLLAVGGLAVSAYAHMQASDVNWWHWADSAFQNFSTEVIGAILTFGLIEILISGREQRRAKEEQRQRDHKQKGELHKSNQLQAISELKRANAPQARQPILDRMKGQTLFMRANLEGVDLREADLSEVNLQGADLSGANLQGAVFEHTNLQGTDLSGANLQGADLSEANLQGAILENTKLVDVIWTSARDESSGPPPILVLFDGSIALQNGTTLPDSTTWAEDTNMIHFTDRFHREYQVTRVKINAIREKMGLDPLK